MAIADAAQVQAGDFVLGLARLGSLTQYAK